MSIILILISYLQIYSQELPDNIEYADAPIWTKYSGMPTNKINWSKVTASGSFVISAEQPNPRNQHNTVTKILGFSATDGELIFQSGTREDLPLKIDDETYEEIPGTPFFSVGGKTRGLAGGNYYIVNSLDGNVAFDTRELGIKNISNFFILPQSASALFIGVKNMKSMVVLYDLNTGKSWVKEKLVNASGIIPETIAGTPLEINENEFIIPTDIALYCINIQTGEMKWRERIPNFGLNDPSSSSSFNKSSSGSSSNLLGGFNKKQPEPEPEKGFFGGENTIVQPAQLARHIEKQFVYLINQNGLNAYDIETGKKNWKKFGFGDGSSSLIFDPKGLIVLSKKIYMYDYDSGEMLWDKPGQFKAGWDPKEVSIANYEHTPQGIVLGIKRVLRQKDYYEFNLLDPETGQLKFDDNFRVKGQLLEMLPCESGIFYTTDFSVGIWDASKGSDAIEPIEVSVKRDFFAHQLNMTYTRPPNGALLTAFNEQMAYIFNTETNFLYAVDTEKGIKSKLCNSPLVFKDEKKPDYIEIRENGIFISSSQNAMLVNFDGNIQYEVNLPSAQYSMLWKFIATASQTYDTYKRPIDPVKRQTLKIKNPKYLDDLKFVKTTAYIAQNTQMSVEFNNVPSINDILNNRYKLSQQGSNYYYILTKWNKTERKFLDTFKEFGVVKVNKDTGDFEKVFPFGNDREPKFIIDEISGNLFYLNESKVSCYKL